jgi:hypothetical protein
MMQSQAVLGFIELSADDHAAAHAWLAPLVAWQDVVGIREPGVLRFVPDEVEALIALGDLDKADQLLRSYGAGAARLARPWAMLAAARSRALHTAAAGDARRAAAALEGAVAQDASTSQPFERARALLTLGSISDGPSRGGQPAPRSRRRSGDSTISARRRGRRRRRGSCVPSRPPAKGDGRRS